MVDGPAAPSDDEGSAAVAQAVDRVHRTLAAYVEAARGSRLDGLAGVGALDPREEQAQLDVGAALAALHESFASSFGHPPLLEPDWSQLSLDSAGELLDDGSEGVELAEGEVLSLQFFVGLAGRRHARRPAHSEDEGEDPWARAYQVVDEAGFAIVAALEEAGYVVPSFASSRGDEDDDEDED